MATVLLAGPWQIRVQEGRKSVLDKLDGASRSALRRIDLTLMVPPRSGSPKDLWEPDGVVTIQTSHVVAVED